MIFSRTIHRKLANLLVFRNSDCAIKKSLYLFRVISGFVFIKNLKVNLLCINDRETNGSRPLNWGLIYKLIGLLRWTDGIFWNKKNLTHWNADKLSSLLCESFAISLKFDIAEWKHGMANKIIKVVKARYNRFDIKFAPLEQKASR